MESLNSASWYRVAELRPRISRHARFRRHEYRGRLWYVVQNPTSRRVHRLTPAAYALVGLMDGRRTAQAIFDAALAELGDHAPTQDDALRVLALLYEADILRCDVPPDTASLFRKVRERAERERRGRRSPLSFRVPLCDPDAFLTRCLPWVRPLFSRAGAAAWCAVVLAAGVTALRQAPELAVAGRALLEPESLVAMWFAYPLVKVLHELGHAFAVKRWGGEVHEIGVLFLVFMPVPYVDASAASLFPDKRQRMLVSAAGIGVELLLAALALLVFVAAEPGWLRHLALAVMLLGGVSTALFNGNPLLRFDGYYVLADALEIPNLDARGRQLTGALVQRGLLGLRNTRLPETTPGEARWLVGYALLASIYRVVVSLGIALFLAGRFFELGVALALLIVVLRMALPLAKWIAFVLTDSAVGVRRERAVAGAVGALILLAVLLFALPLPLRSRGEGVIWLPDRATVRAGTAGFVAEVVAAVHTHVTRGEPLIRLRAPESEARIRSLEAELAILERRVRSLADADRVKAEAARRKRDDQAATLARARERASQRWIESPADGLFILAGDDDLVGRYVEQGDVVAHVVDLADAKARVVVRQQDAGLLRGRTTRAWLRIAHAPGAVLPAVITREVPSASDHLPSAALGTSAGGPFAVDPADPQGTRTLESVFQFELALPAHADVRAAGQRVHARFDHGTEPLAARLYRGVRRVFLRQLGV